MKAIIGLGNPGTKYQNTRHNVGAQVIDALAMWGKTSFRKGWRDPFWKNDCDFFGGNAILVKPATYMNHSGRAAKAVLKRFKIIPERCLVILDDVHLPLGKIRFRPKGSTGGHRGLESIAAMIGTEAFPRIRIGIGSPKDETALESYVLENFSEDEWRALEPQVDRARDTALKWLTHDVQEVMRQFNG